MTFDAAAPVQQQGPVETLAPFDLVLRHFKFPDYIKHLPKQVDVINRSCQRPRNGEWLSMGTGKTLVETCIALFLRINEQRPTVVIMPPNLVPQWGEWLRQITPRVGAPLRVVEYRGTPAQRRKLQLDGADFVLVGIQIFKKDLDRFTAWADSMQDPPHVAVDEATIVANTDSDQHKDVFDFCIGSDPDLLTGTPINKPGDAYGLLKFTNPNAYRNKRHFENMHVAQRDFFDNPTEWQNLDSLKEALMVNGERLLLRDLYDNIEEPLYIPLPYDLSDAHYKLYRKLAEEQLLLMPDGGKIDATTVQKLRHALGQIVLNFGHFSGNEKDKSAGLDLIEQKLDELGGEKLLVFADYRLTVAQIVKRFGKVCAGGYNSEATAAEKERIKKRFINDDSTKIVVLQFISGGKGLNGFQHVCNTALFIEPCLQPRDFHQAVARLARLGQKEKVMAYTATARGTLQVRGFNALLANDSLVNQVIRSDVNLRDAIFGK